MLSIVSLIWVVVFCATLSESVQAHSFEPSMVRILMEADGNYSVAIDADLIELLQIQLGLTSNGPDLIREVTNLDQKTLSSALTGLREDILANTSIRFDGEATQLQTLDLPTAEWVANELRNDPILTEFRIRFQGFGKGPASASSISASFPNFVGDAILVVAQVQRTLVAAGQPSAELTFGAAETRISVIDYIRIGFLHVIPEGLDHILFVIALFFSAARLGELLWIITAFTVAHTVTIGLAGAGLISVPGEIVEPLIAASIAAVAIGNIIRRRSIGWRYLVAFGFGLVHGLGFASVILDIGLPDQGWLLVLLSFGVGIELGQIAVLLGCVVAFGFWRSEAWYRSRIQIPASVVLVGIGGAWTLERLGLVSL